MIKNQKKEKINLFFTFDNEVLFTFKLMETSDGFCMIPMIKDADIHQTIFHKDGKIRTHITHRNSEDYIDDYPLSKHIADQFFVRQIGESIIKRTRKYHGNEKCYVFTKERMDRINPLLPKQDKKGNIIFPLELLIHYLDMDFSKSELWRKIRIRELMKNEPFYGFKYEGRSLRKIQPITERELYSVPISKSTELDNQIFSMLGIDDFFDYFTKTEEGKRWKKEILEDFNCKLKRYKEKQK
jgi:hypothetical protein